MRGFKNLREVLDQKNYVLAVIFAQKAGYPKNEIRHLQEMALKQMVFDYRNGFAVRKLAGEWDFTKPELETILMTALDEHERLSEKKRMEQCYDIKTGIYLTLRQWVERFLSTSK